MKFCMKFLTIIAQILFVYNFAYSQTDPNINLYYNWFDNQVGNENLNLNKGVFHKETFKTLNKSHQYFTTQKFSHGQIVYDGNPYDNILMKYDVFNNKLIIKLLNQKGHHLIVLSNNLIDSFSIKQHHFIKHKSKDNHILFYEVLAKNNVYTLFKRNIKSRNNKIEKKSSYSYFKNSNKYILLYKNKHYDLNSKKDFTQIFKSKKKQIKSFYRLKKTSLKTDPEKFKIELLKHIQENI